MGQGQPNGRGKVGAQPVIGPPGPEAGPACGIKSVAVADQIAGARDHGLGASDLRLG
jgi:hypothetical protein